MITIVTAVMLSLTSFGHVASDLFDNGNINVNLEESYEKSTFWTDVERLIQAVKTKEIEVKKTNYMDVAKVLELEPDEYFMTEDIEYDNDMMLNINCTVRKKYSYVKVISYQFVPVFDDESIEFGYISSYLEKELGKPKEKLDDLTIWEFNDQKIRLTKDTESLIFNIVIESAVDED